MQIFFFTVTNTDVRGRFAAAGFSAIRKPCQIERAIHMGQRPFFTQALTSDTDKRGPDKPGIIAIQ